MMTRMQRRVPVAFISSTVEDLKLYRAAARDAAISARALPVMCDYFTASGARPPLAACLHEVAGAHLVLAIMGYRYGWVPPGQPAGAHKSITWLECECAASANKEILAFLVDLAYPWPAELREGYRLALGCPGR
jgi:hypothetical protein